MITHNQHICLLVTSRQRKDALIRLFNSLKAQDYQDYHVLFGDQNHPEFLDSLFEEFATIFTIERYCIPPCSLSHARNLLLPHAYGDIIALMDDDCYYPSSTLRQVADAFQKMPHMSILCAHPCESPDATVSHVQHTQNAQEIGKYGIFRACPSWVLFFQKGAMLRAGTFDEALGLGSSGKQQSGEETDFALRVLAAGGRAFRLNDIFVYHDALPITQTMLTRNHLYGIGRMAVLKKHRLPLWFWFANIFQPFYRSILFIFSGKKDKAFQQWAIFKGRLQGIFYNL